MLIKYWSLLNSFFSIFLIFCCCNSPNTINNNNDSAINVEIWNGWARSQTIALMHCDCDSTQYFISATRSDHERIEYSSLTYNGLDVEMSEKIDTISGRSWYCYVGCIQKPNISDTSANVCLTTKNGSTCGNVSLVADTLSITSNFQAHCRFEDSLNIFIPPGAGNIYYIFFKYYHRLYQPCGTGSSLTAISLDEGVWATNTVQKRNVYDLLNLTNHPIDSTFAIYVRLQGFMGAIDKDGMEPNMAGPDRAFLSYCYKECYYRNATIVDNVIESLSQDSCLAAFYEKEMQFSALWWFW